MSNHSRGGHGDAGGLDARSGNTSNQQWGSSDTWTWPNDLPEHSTSPPPPRPAAVASSVPHYHRQLPPLSHTNPIASLTAALRGERDTRPQYSTSRQTPAAVAAATAPSRQQISPGRPGSFTFVPDYFFYSPPESPEQSPQPHTQSPTNPAQHRPSHASQNPLRTYAGPSHRPTTPTVAASSAEATGPSPNMPSAGASSTRKRSQTTAAIVVNDSPRAKRQRRSSVVQVDLSLDDDDEEEEEDEAPNAEQELLEKERQELVKRQREESGRAVRINDLTCMICLERFTNMTVTHCGHIFCHECLTQALNASERNSERRVGCCPACRKTIKRGGSNKNQIIPLALMMRPKRKSSLDKRKDPKTNGKPPINLDAA